MVSSGIRHRGVAWRGVAWTALSQIAPWNPTFDLSDYDPFFVVVTATALSAGPASSSSIVVAQVIVAVTRAGDGVGRRDAGTPSADT